MSSNNLIQMSLETLLTSKVPHINILETLMSFYQLISKANDHHQSFIHLYIKNAHESFDFQLSFSVHHE